MSTSLKTDKLTILTASVPGRGMMLGDCVFSVKGQTVQPYQHLISIDDGSLGTIKKYAQLAEIVRTPWMQPVDDDNELLPNHVKVIEPYLTDEWDLVFTYDASGSRARPFAQGTLDESFFAHENLIDECCAVRVEKWREVGGWCNGPFCMDHWFNLRLAQAGGRFLCVPIETWVYGTQEDQWTVGHQ